MKNKNLSDEEKKALFRLKELAKRIHYHNNLYHDKDKSEISDSKFDKLVRDKFCQQGSSSLILFSSPIGGHVLYTPFNVNE